MKKAICIPVGQDLGFYLFLPALSSAAYLSLHLTFIEYLPWARSGSKSKNKRKPPLGIPSTHTTKCLLQVPTQPREAGRKPLKAAHSQVAGPGSCPGCNLNLIFPGLHISVGSCKNNLGDPRTF